MKWLIASDLHGSAKTCKALLQAFDREGADRILFLGDVLYHGPRNDLPEEYAPKEVIRLLNENREKFFCVRGNCDTEVDQMVLEFPILSDYALLSFGSRCIFATHGHVYNKDSLPPLRQGDILLHGHTHIPVREEKEGIWLFNPGSVTIPKNGSKQGYMTWENNVFSWKDLSGNCFDSLTL